MLQGNVLVSQAVAQHAVLCYATLSSLLWMQCQLLYQGWAECAGREVVKAARDHRASGEGWCGQWYGEPGPSVPRTSQQVGCKHRPGTGCEGAI